MSLKVQGFLRVTGFIEMFVGVLFLEYAGSYPPPSCPVAVSCGPPFDNGLYNSVGWVLIVIGLIQIAASFYIGRTRSPTQRAVANPPILPRTLKYPRAEGAMNPLCESCKN